MSLAHYAEHGLFEPRKIAHVLRTTSEEVALTVGLGKDALQRRARIQSDRTQRRLRELVEDAQEELRALLAVMQY